MTHVAPEAEAAVSHAEHDAAAFRSGEGGEIAEVT
jgi:hypothetical protein